MDALGGEHVAADHLDRLLGIEVIVGILSTELVLDEISGVLLLAEIVVIRRRARQERQAFTVDVLGEACVSEEEASAYQRLYLDLVERLGAEAQRWPVASQLYEAPWGPLPRVKPSTKNEGHERRYFYGSVWAVCIAQPVLWLLWTVLPRSRAFDALKLAIFVGIEVISKVPSMLHTPLMSGTNAIHGIVLVGGMLVAGSADSTLEQVLAFVAVVFGTINIVGGFLVTDRMLEMFKRRPEDRPDE